MNQLPEELIRAHKGISFVGVSVSFVCYNNQGKVFFAKRSTQTRDEHGRWDCGGGGLKVGESVEQALRRELTEEYNVHTLLQVTPLGYYDIFRTNPDGLATHWLALPFAIKVKPREVKIMEPAMFEDSGWFDLDHLPQPLHSAWASLFPDEFWQKLRQTISAGKAGVY